MGTLYLCSVAGIASSDAAWALQRALVTHVESAWSQPDSGIWEVRGPRRTSRTRR